MTICGDGFVIGYFWVSACGDSGLRSVTEILGLSWKVIEWSFLETLFSPVGFSMVKMESFEFLQLLWYGCCVWINLHLVWAFFWFLETGEIHDRVRP